MFEYLFRGFQVDRSIPGSLEEPPFQEAGGPGARNMP